VLAYCWGSGAVEGVINVRSGLVGQSLSPPE